MGREREADRIYREIYRRIAGYEYRPGERLRERDLMEEFGTSRTPIRDAIILLAGEGLLSVVPSTGTFVNKVSFKEMMEVYEVRLNLVELSGRLAAQRIRPEEMKEYERLLEEVHKEDDPEAIIGLDSSFHELINRSTRNEKLYAILKNLKIQSLTIWEYPVADSYYQTIATDFTSLYEAIREGNREESGTLLKAHVQRILDHIKELM